MARVLCWSLLLLSAAPVRLLAGEAADLLGVMYWTDRTKGLYRAARDGSEIELIVPRRFIDSIAVDREGGKLYWTAINGRFTQLWQGNLDGSEQIMLADDLKWVGDVAFDPVDKHVYVSSIAEAKVIRFNADGTERTDFLVGIHKPSRLYVDVKQRKLYWAGHDQRRIDCIKLDGSDRQAVLENLPGVSFAFVIDPVERKIYWSFPRGAIYRSKLDGSDREQLASGLDQPDGLAIDADNRKLYWVERGKLSQSELDGSQPETLVTGKSDLYSSLEILPPVE